MTAPVFPAAPADLPSRAEPATFSARTDATIVWEKEFRDVLAASIPFYEGTVTDSEQAVKDAEAQVALAATAATVAASSANFVGAWSGLTGALNIPASVSHSGSIWILNVNLANVRTSEPASANGDWVSVFSGAYADLSGKPTLGTAAALATGTTSGTIPVLGVGGILPSGVLPPTSTPLFDKSLFGGN